MNHDPLTPMLKALDEAIHQALPQEHAQAELDNFYRLIRNYPERGGKRLRGLLVLLSAAAHGADWRKGLELAAALELFQNWVLIHDDIEDGSLERRGTPALHRQVGMPVALNVGDALHVYMWRLLHNLQGFSDETRDKLLNEFETMIQRTAEGQHLDLYWVAEERFDISEGDYMQMVTLKSAHYTVISPLRLGAFCAKVVPDERFHEAGEALGVAFQIRDDVLNLMPDIAYGKEFAGDLLEGKRTLILAHLFAHASSAEREDIEARLAKTRDDKTEGDIRRLLGYIERYGSLAYAQSVAEQQAQQGLETLGAITEKLTNADATRELTGLLESLARRSH